MHPDQVIGIFELAVTKACRDPDRAKSFDEAYENYVHMDLSGCRSFSEALAEEEFLHNTAAGIIGKEFCLDYFRYTASSTALPSSVQLELKRLIDQDTSFDKLKVDWESAKAKMQEAYDVAIRSGTLQTEMDQPLLANSSQPELTAHPANLEYVAAGLKDILLKCERLKDGSVCGKDFTHTVADQIRYKTLKLNSLPKGCPDCRRDRALGQGKAKLCPEFEETGSCKFGDQCRHTHREKPLAIEPPAAAHPVQPTSDSDEPGYIAWHAASDTPYSSDDHSVCW